MRRARSRLWSPRWPRSPEVIGSANGLVIAFLALVTRGEVSPAGRVDPAVLGKR